MGLNPIPFQPTPRSPFNPTPSVPSLADEMEANWQLSVTDQFVGRINELRQPVEPGFNPWDHLAGYETSAELLVKARSAAEMNLMKQRLDLNNQARDILNRGEWGWMAGLASSVGDPLSLIPIPGSVGIGFLKGAAKASAGNFGVAAVTEPFLMALDPQVTWNEVAYSIGGAALFGAALGGAVGGIGAQLRTSRENFLRGRADMNLLPVELSELEAANVARPFNAAEQNYDVVTGHTGLFENGRYEPVKVEVLQLPLREKRGSDGNLYHYDDSFGWVLEADRGLPSPRAVAQDMLDELGVPDRSTEYRMVVDEAALKADFEEGKHLEPTRGREPLATDDIRTAKEYITFKQIEADLKRIDPPKLGEDPLAYGNRIQRAALEDLKGRRAASSVSARNSILAPLLDLANFSPVAKAVRLFKWDNILGDLPQQIAGDYGWAIRANEFGQATPPSLLMRAMRHNVAFNEIRQAIDDQWVKFVQKNTKATGMSFMGQNVTASAEAMKARLKNMTGSKVMTKDQFVRMAGRAVFEKDTFRVDDFEVVPEAREAAKAWTRIAQRYDREARELGLFYDQRSLERTVKRSSEKLEQLKSSQAKWLWGATGQPEKLAPAIRIKVTEKDFQTPDAGIYQGFHGSQTGFTTFDASKLGGNTGAQSAYMGFFFSKSPDTANTYTAAERLDSAKQEEAAARFAELEKQAEALIEAHNARYDTLQKEADTILFPLGGVFETRWDRDGWSVVDSSSDELDFFSDEERIALWGQEAFDQRIALRAAYERIQEMVNEFNSKEAFARQDWQAIDDEMWDLAVDEMKGSGPDGSSVHPVKLVMLNPYVYDQKGKSYRERKYAEIIDTAKREGHDSVIIQNTIDTMDGDPKIDDIYVVFDNSQIVSVFDEAGLSAANKLGDREVEQVFTGATTSEAMARLLDVHPDADIAAATQGYVLKAAAPDAPAVAKRSFTKVELGDEVSYLMDGQEVTRDEWMNEKMAYQRETFEARAASRRQAADLNRTFRTADQLVKDRIDSLSEPQRFVYDQWQDQIDRLEQTRAKAEMDLRTMQEQPHRFVDQYGEQEPYFARYWNHTAISADREKFKKLLTAWYQRDNPVGAAERAESTIDNMLKTDAEDEQPVSIPGLKHLTRRKLDMPNSFKVSDPQLGEIAAADFFNTDLEVVAEAYTRGMGHKIEAARMFGDAGLWQKMEEIEEHWRERVLVPAQKKGTPRAELAKLRETFDEYAGWIDIIRKGVLGGLKTTDPWSLPARTARNLKNFQILTSMGRVLLTAIPEAMRVPMVNGFATAHRGIWLRAFSDWDKIKGNVELSRQTGELFDLVRDLHAARVAELNQPDPSGGGKWWEKRLESLVPGFLKLVGQTHWTVMLKDLTMFTAQHKVMDLARNIDVGDNAFKLAAIGISKRDAKLLASMPIDQHGSIILPAVQNWSGSDGRRARTLLIDAIHAEARRAIVTPSFADKSLLFQGIAARKGKVQWENDLMSVPLQFMSYGLAASQKVLMSGLQGRDQNFWMGAFGMFLLGIGSNYLKQPQTATMNKSLEEWLIEGYESSGVGGFWFSDLNQMIERYTYNTVGLRPLFGADPRFGKTTGVGDLIDVAGPSIGTLADVVSAFADPEKSATNRAQAIRRAVPYNNVIWWGYLARDMATAAGKAAQ